MTKNRKLTPELVQLLRKSNQVVAQFDAAIACIEAALRKAEFTVSARVPLSERVALYWGLHEGRWQLLYEDDVVPGVWPLTQGVWPLTQAPLQICIEALGALPQLLDALLEAEET